METLTEMKERLNLPRINQIGVVVKDIERAVDSLESLFHIGPFTVYEFVPDRHWYKEEPSSLRLLMGKAMWGETEFELIQPLEGRTIHQEFLDLHGEGLQHLGFHVRDFDETFRYLTGMGFEPLMRAESHVEMYGGDLKACYFDTRRVAGIICEIIWKSWLPECQPE
jgi:methylmalonyl-CoA/ethylmalonyl-CoA epimerase